MSDSTNAILQRAHELIEANQHEQAQELLAPLLESESENPAFWWVYTHAVTDGVVGGRALDRVLQLDPTYPGARELKEEVLAAQALVAEEIEAQSGPAVDLDELSHELAIDDWEEIQPAIEQEAASAGTGRGFVLLIVALLLGTSGLLLVLSGVIDIEEIVSMFGAPTAEPVIVVSVSTAAPTAEPVIVVSTSTAAPTAEPVIVVSTSTTAPTAAATVSTDVASAVPESVQPTSSATTAEDPTPAEQIDEETQEPEATPEASESADAPSPTDLQTASVSEFIASVTAGLSAFEIDQSQSAARSTSLGETIDIRVCAATATQFNERLNGIMDAAVSQYASMPKDIDAFAVSLVNCDDPDASVRTIGVTRDIVTAYANRDIDRKTFQQSWQPLS